MLKKTFLSKTCPEVLKPGIFTIHLLHKNNLQFSHFTKSAKLKESCLQCLNFAPAN